MNDATTIERCKAGEQSAFTELFCAHRDGAYRYCLGMLGSHSDAVDIVQESFLAAFQGIARLDSARGFSGWFYGIARHLCLATLRQRKRETVSSILVNQAADSPSPEDNATNLQRRELLVSCLDGMTHLQREIILLRELEGLSYQEVADWLQVPLGTVMSRLYDARRALAKLLKEKTGGER